MSGLVIASAYIALMAQAGSTYAPDTPIFDQADLAEDVSIVTYGIMRDTRCNDPELCFQEERLVVAAVVTSRGQQQGLALEMGVPVRIADGWLTLVSSATRPALNGATALNDYSFDFEFTR